MNHPYSILKICVKTETACSSRRPDIHHPPGCFQPASLTNSGVDGPSFTGFHRSPPLRRTVLPHHDHLVFMKSQFG
jgi:hypothetical protein